MFGYIKTYASQLRLCELAAYKAVYCGLCHQLGKRFGPAVRMTLSYDFTFLAMLQMALDEKAPKVTQKRCTFNPFKKEPTIEENPSLDYACDVAVLMLWHKLEDDRDDDGFFKSLAARAGLWLVRRNYQAAAQRQPELCRIFAEAMEKQSYLEKQNCASIDEASEPTAEILAAVFSRLGNSESQARVLDRLGRMMGRYVYLADALDDLEKDKHSSSYNPFLLSDPNTDLENQRLRAKGSLFLTIAEASKAYELLTVYHFGPVLENILFLGLRSEVEQLMLPPKERKANRAAWHTERTGLSL